MENDNNQAQQEQGSCTQDLITCNEQLKKTTERLAYLTADFDNYRRRMEKDRLQWMEIAQRNVLSDLLEIADDLERFYNDFKSLTLTEDLKQRLQGIELLHKSFQKLLPKYSLEEIETQRDFNPDLHEAIMQVEDASKKTGSIVSVLQKGYKHKGAVLRPAKVSVAQ